MTRGMKKIDDRQDDALQQVMDNISRIGDKQQVRRGRLMEGQWTKGKETCGTERNRKDGEHASDLGGGERQ